MMNGVYDPNDTSAMPDGGTFVREIMKRTEEEVAAELGRAEEFFRDRFSLDFTDVEAVDGIKTTVSTRNVLTIPTR